MGGLSLGLSLSLTSGAIGAEAFSLVDFQNGVYTVDGTSYALTDLIGDNDPYWYGGTFNSAWVVGGTGLTNAAGWAEFGIKGALITKIAAEEGCTFVAEYSCPNAVSNGLYADIFDAGAHNYGHSYTLVSSTELRASETGAANVNLAGMALGTNKVAMRASRGFIGVAKNSANSFYRAAVNHAYPFDAVNFGINGSGGRDIVLRKLTFYSPTHNEAELLALSAL